MRIQPQWYVGVAVLILYMALVAALWASVDFQYDQVQDSVSTITRGIILPIGVGSLFLIGVTTWLGWWGPVMRERPRLAPRWTLVVPVVVGLVALLNLSTLDLGVLSVGYLVTLTVGVALIGFAEELVCRGIVVVGLRGNVSEVWVWLLSSVLFGFLHSINALFGQSLADTVQQMIVTSLIGSLLYVSRMATGTLVVPMVLHALWDLGALGGGASGGQPPLASGLLTLAAMVTSFVAAVVIARAVRGNAAQSAAVTQPH